MKTVLLADDEASGRKLVRAVLESCGYSVLEAGDGKSILDQARQAHPDFIILSLNMPVVDGLDAVCELRRDDEFNSTPIVALTSGAVNADPDLALSAGFSGYITMADLRDQVTRLLRLAPAASC